ncbi:MAG: hypothetical protein ABSA32_08935 [Candidatus Acidiferrales bacterium]|jgi:tRNA(Leu) C34 or U34 (ribose-2'-O)-methylase TrmL
MPAYNNALPPLALFPGDVGYSFNGEALPATASAGAQFALTNPSGFASDDRTVRWQTIFATAPSAVNIQLQGAMADVDSEYATLAAPVRQAARHLQFNTAVALASQESRRRR